jgi:hypothetical protein
MNFLKFCIKIFIFDVFIVVLVLIFCSYTNNLNLKDFSKYLQNAGLIVCAIGAFILVGGLYHHRTFNQQYIGTMSQYKTHKRIKLMLEDQKKKYATYFVTI